jgi:hypothetical protein
MLEIKLENKENEIKIINEENKENEFVEFELRFGNLKKNYTL